MKPLKWILARATEGSTWASIAALLGTASTLSTNPATKAAIIAAATAAGAIGAALPDAAAKAEPTEKAGE